MNRPLSAFSESVWGGEKVLGKGGEGGVEEVRIKKVLWKGRGGRGGEEEGGVGESEGEFIRGIWRQQFSFSVVVVVAVDVDVVIVIEIDG